VISVAKNKNAKKPKKEKQKQPSENTPEVGTE